MLFQSTRPVRGATTQNSGRTPAAPFQSTRPVRGATGGLETADVQPQISIHAPRAGRDCGGRRLFGRFRISIHAPRAGRDAAAVQAGGPPGHFNPRAPCGARRWTEHEVLGVKPFQSTRPVRGATHRRLYHEHVEHISIHAPRAGRDLGQNDRALFSFKFQSTRPVRGATAKVYKITLHTFATKGNS